VCTGVALITAGAPAWRAKGRLLLTTNVVVLAHACAPMVVIDVLPAVTFSLLVQGSNPRHVIKSPYILCNEV
jgi:hypothetical protein